MYEIYNYLNQKIDMPTNSNVLFENYKKILSIMSPIIPHFTSECLKDLKLDIFQKWPEVDKVKLENEFVEFVIQVNGKKRATLKTKKDITEISLLEQIKKDEKTKKIIENKIINKSFFVKNRLINILIK